MNIGERIRKARKKTGLTQEDLAKLVNKSSQVISNWERGYTTTINHDDITKLTLALKVRPGYLLGIDQPLISEEERKKEEIKKALTTLVAHDDGEFPIENDLINTIYDAMMKGREFHTKRKQQEKENK